MMLVVLESPYAAGNGRTVEENLTYARECMADSIKRGEFPIASHLLYTQPGILDDNIPAERALGIVMGLEWGKLASKVVVYTDYGISLGVKRAIGFYLKNKIPMEQRTIK